MIYLDNAATSYPKPNAVLEEMRRCMIESGGNAGRGSHVLARRAAEELLSCREALADLMGLRDPLRVIFTMNATMAINTVLKGILSPGDHVLLSDLEHNAVWRPIDRMASEGRITYDVYPTHAERELPSAERILFEIRRLLKPNTRMVIAVHASNICGAILPLEAIGDLCRQRGMLFVVDGAQSAGHLPIDMDRMKIDALCIPGHKGLLGPQGSGALLLSERMEPSSLIEGGSGVYSLDATMPEELPERLEAGTLAMPAVAGFLAGIRTVEELGVEQISRHERALCRRLKHRLEKHSTVRILAPHLLGNLLSFVPLRFSSDALGEALDARGFCVRAGHHCAALAHQTLGSVESGAVRVSPGLYTTSEEVDAFAEAVEEILTK